MACKWWRTQVCRHSSCQVTGRDSCKRLLHGALLQPDTRCQACCSKSEDLEVNDASVAGFILLQSHSKNLQNLSEPLPFLEAVQGANSMYKLPLLNMARAASRALSSLTPWYVTSAL